jgi:hypothetical protein
MLNPNNTPRFGTDPEAFLSKNGAIVGSEKLIPEKGIRTYAGKVVRDGVQFELNPVSSNSIQELGSNIGHLLQHVAKRANKLKLSLNFDGLVEVSRKELDSLSPGSRVLGCMPSYNVYEERPITVNPVLYRKRSAGGHIHNGIRHPLLMQERRRMVPYYDIFVGTGTVLLDRDPGAVERRENYGRAGECRFPDHGLEYRTTSNFWLRNYALMSFTFGMAAIAYEVAFQCLGGNNALQNSLQKAVNIKRIVQAIDDNDFDLALRNFKKLVPFLKRNLPAAGYPLNPKNLDNFIGFAQDVNARSIEEYFPTEDIVENWQRERIGFAEWLK